MSSVGTSEKSKLLSKKRTYTPQSKNPITQKAENKSDGLFIVVAGKTASGKSTALNNIFDLDFKTGLSVESVTTNFEMKTIKDKLKDDTVLHIIDTPGFEAVDISSEEIAAAMSWLKNKIGSNYILIYCVSICFSGKISQADVNIVTLLHQYLDKNMWNRCVVLFTFSDILRKQTDEKVYLKYLNDSAKRFTEYVLKPCGSDATVRTIFEEEKEKVKIEIMALPVGIDKELKEDIMLNLPSSNMKWTDFVFQQIIEKTKGERTKSEISSAKFAATTISGFATHGLIGGAAIGGSGGAITGACAAGLAIPICAGAGAGIGAGVGFGGGLIVGTITAATVLAHQYKKKKDAEDLLSDELRSLKKNK